MELIIGSTLFWALLLTLFIAVLITEECKLHGASSSLILISIIGIVWFGKGVLAWIMVNYLLIIIVAVSYFIIGAIWSSIRWVILLRKRGQKYVELREKWLLEHKYSSISDHIDEWRTYLIRTGDGMAPDAISRFVYYGKISIKPPMHVFKYDIMSWIGYWPWSMLWWFIGDFLRDVCELLYTRLVMIYSYLSNYYLGKYENELNPND